MCLDAQNDELKDYICKIIYLEGTDTGRIQVCWSTEHWGDISGSHTRQYPDIHCWSAGSLRCIHIYQKYTALQVYNPLPCYTQVGKCCQHKFRLADNFCQTDRP